MSWCAVYTQPQAENLAAQQLQNQAFEVYVPMYLKRRIHARRETWSLKPLFPRYIFVRLIESTPWRSIRSTIGVHDLVYMGDQPAKLDDVVITEIRQREDDDGVVRMPTAEGYKKGDQVRITRPGLGELFGLFEERSDSDRVFVLLDLLGRKVRTQVREGDLQGA